MNIISPIIYFYGFINSAPNLSEKLRMTCFSAQLLNLVINWTSCWRNKFIKYDIGLKPVNLNHHGLLRQTVHILKTKWKICQIREKTVKFWSSKAISDQKPSYSLMLAYYSFIFTSYILNKIKTHLYSIIFN